MPEPKTPLPWARNEWPDEITDVTGVVVGNFRWRADAAYATKAANMHERLVGVLRDMLTIGCPLCSDDDKECVATCPYHLLLKEAAE